MNKLSFYLVSDSVIDFVASFINDSPQNRLKFKAAPYNQVTQILLSEPSYSNLFIWTSPDIQIPSYSKLISFEKVDQLEIIEEVLQFASLIKLASKKYKSIFMLSWVFPPERRWPLVLSRVSNSGAADVLSRMNITLAENLSHTQNFYLIDQTALLSNFTKSLHDPRLYAMARIRYSLDYQKYVAQKIQPILSAMVVPSRKLIICDLDNTLWGGVVGDDGINNLKIGGNDPIGEAHLQLQKELKTLNNRGILLAISSKNDSETALNVINNHPNMILKDFDFAAKRINWEDKANNILSLLKELKLLPSSAVFLDDNPSERKRVKDALPEIIVPELPIDVSDWSGILNSMTCFETIAQSNEDLKRAENYKIESKRIEEQKLFKTLEDWLQSLKLVVKVENLSSTSLSRVTQLLNKTNQFNLKTRRLSQIELEDWINKENRFGFNFSISDRYGDSGLTAFVSIEEVDRTYHIIDFVMSCRIMGKGVEDAILAKIIEIIEEPKILKMEAIPTERNSPIIKFTEKVTNEGFVDKHLSCPSHIKLVNDKNV